MSSAADTHALNARLLRFRSHPDQEDAQALAEDLIAARRFGDARGVAVSAQTDDGPSDARLLVLEARAWYMDRDLVRAQAALVRAARLDPQSAEAFRWMGEVLLKRGDPLRAQRALERAVELAPEEGDAPRLLERARQLARHAPEETAEPPHAAPARARRTPADPPPASREARPAPGERQAPDPPRTPAPFPAEEEEATSSYRRSSIPGAPAQAITGAGLHPSPVSLSSAGVSGAGVRTSPGSSTGAGTRSSPASRSGAGAQTSPGTSPAGTRTGPGTTSSAGLRSSPGTTSSAGLRSSPGRTTSAGVRSSPGTTSSAGLRSSPGTTSGAGLRSSPGMTTSAGLRSSPGTTSGAGLRSSPGVTTSAGTRPAAAVSAWPEPDSDSDVDADVGAGDDELGGFDDLSNGALDGGYEPSRPGTLSSPGAYASAPEVSPAEARRTFSGTLPASVPPPPEPPPASIDVEIEVAESAARAALPGAGHRLGFASAERAPAPRWEAPSVVAMWPSLESLGEPPLPQRTPVDAPAEQAFDAAAAGDAESEQDASVRSGLDLPLGETAGLPDDPAAVLETLREQGVFEPPDDASPAPAWAQASDVPRTGPQLGRTLLGVWAVSLVLLGAGYLGYRQWIEHRHGTAAELVAEARAAAFDSDHARLVDAERLLRQARDNHPRSARIPEAELFVHAQRVLENGSRDLSSLRAAASRATRLGADPAHLAAARAVLAVYSGTPAAAQALLDKAKTAAEGEPALLYVVGRLEQRIGRAEQASAHLGAAAAAAPELVAASLALAELQYERGEAQDALARLDAVLKLRPRHLRAQLWRAFLRADADDPAQALRALEGLAQKAREGAPVDRILWALASARVQRRSGAHEPAGAALREAVAAGASEPRLLALVATDARRAGELGVAQQAASQALAAAPESSAYRALLAAILLERSDGERALRLLQELPADEPMLIAMRARAALQTGDPQALRTALQALDARAQTGATDGEAAALRLRLRAALEPDGALLQQARALLRRAPGDPDALRASGDVALALREPAEAVRAFEKLARLMAQDAEAHYLLGRARRMAADAKGAESALQRALELSPGYVSALGALGGLLLDSGRHAEADAIYQQLAAHDALQARLGRAEALLGLGKLDDAQVQVSGVPEAQRDGPAVREVAARVALADGKPGAALTLLRPLIEGEGKAPSALALYGDALYAADQVNAAAGAYDAALELDAGFPEALLGRANVHLRAERAAEALELLARARAALDDRLRAPEMRARLFTLLGHGYLQRAKRGDEARAREALRQAVRLPAPPPEAHFFLGEALGGKRTTEAAEAFKRYLELEPRGDYAERARRALGPLL